MFSYTVDAQQAIRRLTRIERQIPYATSLALNKTAYLVRDALIKKMPEVFDRPTPYTMRALWVKRAKKTQLEAEVGLKDGTVRGTSASKYLGPQVFGGARKQKRFERSLSRIGPTGYYIPGAGATLDAYGNMSRGEIVRLLSYFEAFSEGGYRANSTPQSRARLAKVRKSEYGYRKINGVQYFISRGKGSMSGNREQHLKEGVYSKTGTHGAIIKPVLIFTEKAPTYTPTLPFYETAEEVYGKQFESEYTKALDHAIATSR